MTVIEEMNLCENTGGHYWEDYRNVADRLTLEYVCRRCGAQCSDPSRRIVINTGLEGT